tara:strand:- start:397 stop:630 length:234 start_codon:yes stop_codon:yes gene_type:complete
MKITRTQLKQIIKEELSTLEEGSHQFTVGQLQDLMMDTGRAGKVRIQLDGSGPDLDVFEWMTTDDGDILLSVEAPRR